MIHAGRLNERIEIQSRGGVRNDYGEVDPEAWDTDFWAWANVRPMRGTERYDAQQVRSDVTHKVTIYWRDGITTRHRIRLADSGRVLNILELININEGDESLEMLCAETEAV